MKVCKKKEICLSSCPPVWSFITKVLLWWVAHNKNDKTFLRIDQVALSCPKISKRAKVYRKKPSKNISLCRLQRFAHIKVSKVMEFEGKGKGQEISEENCGVLKYSKNQRFCSDFFPKGLKWIKSKRHFFMLISF